MIANNPYHLPHNIVQDLKKLKGPIAIFGAGGFIGINLLNYILSYRNDVVAVSQDPYNNWRLMANKIPNSNLFSCDVNDYTQLKNLVDTMRPQTIFNLSAYGAYSKQNEYKKIYHTNFNASVDMIELLKENKFSAYIHAGSSSEYGINSAAPTENDALIPNSHYAVSKTAVYHVVKYYGIIEKLPVVHLRLYSVYGPWEEPDRLIPVLVSQIRKNKLPPLVNPAISRDFIYISDVCCAFIKIAARLKPNYYGRAYNIGSGKKTTIKELAALAGKIAGITKNPKFCEMPDRKWDLTNWYANIASVKKEFTWEPFIRLPEGIKNIMNWQEKIGFDNAAWNYTRNK